MIKTLPVINFSVLFSLQLAEEADVFYQSDQNKQVLYTEMIWLLGRTAQCMNEKYLHLTVHKKITSFAKCTEIFLGL